ncbi:pantoate--beta-alanine ligase [Ponticaulis sp.]|uniref:pantoate--beta-alanine ligase n=1 Tax=Ponticaulis sp. TaxID=2020902 RepID=UPI000B692F20|nr:pantoate--beta-alanine ligase [Ponticaulis sp.]MAI89720.1 pantoate--beta-alanine ligase [Ponticaulis sp.]OUY00736.1 MAG: pantoate--beta-alanine ligase [Hyphomonadaceae bacterium TMED5]|tara:strand:- start:59784 stop:60626 length:843 start_codon:yes stop_codon:yes gene_type:complete
MQVVRTLEELRSIVRGWKREGLSVGFVPTMGALHAGHLSLVDLSTAQCDRTIASIFVNPTQFAPHEDLDSYPRQEQQDHDLLRGRGCDLVFCPEVSVMYPEGEETRVSVPQMGAKLEGPFRPHFFGGVATVVAKLFNQVEPDKAFFGEKDYQQVQVIKRMVIDLCFGIEIVPGPTARAGDGLALSSRNAYLSAVQRAIAPVLFASLHRCAIRMRNGTPPEIALAEAKAAISKAGFENVEYVDAVDPGTLDQITDTLPDYPCRLIAAAWLGKTRLIDNIAL